MEELEHEYKKNISKKNETLVKTNSFKRKKKIKNLEEELSKVFAILWRKWLLQKPVKETRFSYNFPSRQGGSYSQVVTETEES